MRQTFALVCIAAAVGACARGMRGEATPPLAAGVADAAARQAAALDPDGGPPLSAQEQIDHALSRVTFGSRATDRERVARVGVAAFIEEQLHPERIDDARLNQELARLPLLRRSPAELAQQVAAASPPVEEERDPSIQPGRMARRPRVEIVAQLAQAKLLRAVDSEKQLQEVMTDFWFNHFNVFFRKNNLAALLPSYEQALRERALGNFRELLVATARSPAMLVYLDNWRSSTPLPARGRRGAQGPGRERGLNENYARELLELHTLGVDGGYTQQDIVEVARCFTGWTVAEPRRDPRFIFRAGMHDPGVKHVLGHDLARGGEDDGNEVLDLLARHPSTARFISLKLARRFVSDDPPEALVSRVAETFTQTDGDIRSVLRTIFESPEFWSRRVVRAKVRSPLELVAGSVRALGARIENPTSLTRAVARTGEPLFAAQPPTGYADSADSWLSPGAVLARIDFGLALAGGQLDGVKVDLAPLSRGARGPEEILDRAAARIGASGLSERTREYVLDQLRDASPQPEVVAARAVGLLLGSPELQRR